MLCFKSINFNQNRPKIKLFLQKILQNFERGESPVPDFLSAGVSAPRSPKAPCPHCISLATRLVITIPIVASTVFPN